MFGLIFFGGASYGIFEKFSKKGLIGKVECGTYFLYGITLTF